MNYINYHCHSSMSNISTPDSTVSNRDRAMRVSELGQKVLSGVEHGWCGRFIEIIELSKEFNLRPLLGAEVYIVKNRFEKDRTNAHLILLAKNENGRKAINRILSEANISGFYYKARIDLELLFTLPKNDIWVTSACLAGFPWKYDDSESIIIQIRDYFQENFYLEVQNHNVESQKILNTRILELSKKYNIKIIAGMDSHLISENQYQEREDYLLSRGIEYPEENDWYLDWPSYDEAFKRFEEQGILNQEQIAEALNNTSIFEKVEPYTSVIFDPDIIKLPTLYSENSQEEKNKILENLIWEQWEKEKIHIDKEKHSLYKEEIRKELDTVFITNMSDYFLLDYEVIKHGKELGGQITLTGRGSAPSFYLSKLLGFTTIDRISASVKLFPERFISAERLLETKSLPDIDFNLGNPEVFAQAQNDILGEGHSYPMIAFGTVKVSGAWKLYSRISNIDFETANEVSEQLQKYEMDLKHTDNDEEKDLLNVLDYIDPKYHQILNESKKYLGLVNSLTPHPCGYIIFNHGDIREEFGLIKIKTGNVEHICACCDGLFAENYKLLKNDLLKVSVVKLIYDTYHRIGIEPHTLPELITLCENNQKVWEVYSNGWTKGINQFEQTGTRGRATKYKPQNISELSAFVAAIRPGFKSNYALFESRMPFEYGIKSLDNLIQTKEFPYSFMLYQENAMQVMGYSSIPISKTYEIIKNIAKKRVEKVKKYKDQFIIGMKKKLSEEEQTDTQESKKIALMTWQVIDDSSQYSFNACISGKTKIKKMGSRNNKFDPTVEEMFFIKNNIDYAKENNHISLHKKYNNLGYGNALSMFEDGKIRKNKIIDIRESGMQKTYKITMSNGSSIVCTNNHKFPTPLGDKKLSELSIGDSLYVQGEYEKNTKNHKFSKDASVNNLPKKGQKGFQTIVNASTVIFLDYKKSKQVEKCACEICGEKYDGKRRFEVHHKDGDETNNCIENYLWCCSSCHKKEHYKMGRTKIYEKGLPTHLATIINIDFQTEEMVYDIEMGHPAHNFISDSGLVTSNSHSYSVAGDSLYGAYLKSHYPLEFYETFLNILEEDADKDRLAEVKIEAQEAYHIQFPPLKFDQDNRRIVGNTNTKEISQSMKILKGFGDKIGEQFYELSKNFTGDNFLDLLVYAEENGYLSSKWLTLIKLNYFDKFGNNQKLLSIYNEFIDGENKYKKSYVEKTKIKRLESLKNIWDNLPNKRIRFSDQLANEFEILGSIQSMFPKLDNKYQYFYVKDISLKYAPRFEGYNLRSAKQGSLKVYKKAYWSKPFGSGDIIKCSKDWIDRKENTTLIDGRYVPTGTGYTYFLTKFEIVKPEELDKILEEKINA